MARTHYEILGVKTSATQAEVKSAYRRIVFEHHPDRSKKPGSVEVFRNATDAYEVLSDPERRRTYDRTLEQIAAYEAEKRRKAQERRQAAKAANFGIEMPNVTPDVTRLTSLYARGRMAEAEALALRIRVSDPRQPIPYAVLGDIARSKGNVNEAAKMYAYAAQFDPANTTFQRRYEELLNASTVVQDRRSTRLAAKGELAAAPLVGFGVVLLACGWIAFSESPPVFGAIAIIGTWTASLLFMLFVAGLAVGSSLSIGNYLDRFLSVSTTASGRLGPAAVLGAVAVVNFWIAVALYLVLGLSQRAFNYSTSRLVLGVVFALLFMTAGSALTEVIDPLQVVLWGGNVSYFGALVGWMVCDAFRS